ncbi:MAG: transcriptional regulator [Chloroflexi bacterium HGW-Chloroflexi-8]|nr:MAG: transcriptional regulator [Chloroflexi bacterium HGW-Chloroflexi-8]
MNNMNSHDPAWYCADLHIHTPASTDFQQPNVSMLDILQRAESRGLDIISITDHNTIAGYRQMMDQIKQLRMLKDLNRLLPEEKITLDEYDRLFSKILVLPGFEFTATFGFHILAIFPPNKSVRELEHLLLSLNIAPALIDEGSQTVGATCDVLTAYKLINEAGGIVIAAHANSSNGVAMRGFNFGGQTKIAFTQDSNLHALEVTDLEVQGNRTTASFFNGTKPEYPRKMHCIQGSDSHRLTSDLSRKKVLGIGDRTTDIFLIEKDFNAMLDVFRGNDFSKTRPHRATTEPSFNFLLSAQKEGSNIIQEFHESMTIRGGKLYAILADVCSFSNTNGGTLFIGLSADSKKEPLGLNDVEKNIVLLEKSISDRIRPPIDCKIDSHEINGKKVLRVLVPRGDDPPYALDDYKIYIREETETNLAVRDEIVNLVIRGKEISKRTGPTDSIIKIIEKEKDTVLDSVVVSENILEPKTGIELVLAEERNGIRYFTVRDLRNGNIVKNVTQTSARRLWQYAIKRYIDLIDQNKDPKIIWSGNFGLLRKYKVQKYDIFDLVYKEDDTIRYFFGVTSIGIHGKWKSLTGDSEDS